MERLTRRTENGTAIYAVPNEDPAEWAHNRHNVLEKLTQYEDLEESGRLVKLPCAVGDTVYVPGDNNDAVEFVVSGFTTYEDGEWLVALEDGSPFTAYVAFDDVFASPEEAEAKLKEMEGEQ